MVDESLAREQTRLRMAASRAEIRRILDPPPRTDSDLGSTDGEFESDSFPRSRTMKLLLSGRGIGTVGAMVGGLLISRPALAFRLLRMLPTGAVAKMLLVKGLTALRSKRAR
jgi:hypothetical protein